MKIGVLALQGAFREHIISLESLGGVTAVAVRLPEQLEGLDGLIIPGGESTAISKLMVKYDMYDAIEGAHARGMAVWGTCAGLILIAKSVTDGIEGQRSLALMDIVARRNAFGRQIDSFETDLRFGDLGTIEGIFIRAPWIDAVGEGVEVLATFGDHVVAARQGDLLATAFHPELTGDTAVHRYFVEEVVGAA